jgi:hypothetical protein
MEYNNYQHSLSVFLQGTVPHFSVHCPHTHQSDDSSYVESGQPSDKPFEKAYLAKELNGKRLRGP